MSVRWETEGLQTVGIVCLVIMFLKLMHLLGLIDITETGETTWDRCSDGGRTWKVPAGEITLTLLNTRTETFALSVFVNYGRRYFTEVAARKGNLLSRAHLWCWRVRWLGPKLWCKSLGFTGRSTWRSFVNVDSLSVKENQCVLD